MPPMNLPRRLLPAPALLLAAAAAAQGPSAPADPPDAFARTTQLVEQGEHEMRVGDLPAAERSFLDALQAVRVTYGLAAPEQRPVLRRLIAAQLAQEKWGAADRRLGYFEWVNDRIYERHFYEYLRGTRELGRLLLDASAIAGNPRAPQYLEEAKNLYWRAVSAIEATLGEESVELAPWLYEIVLTHHYRSAMSRRTALVPYARDARDGGPFEGWTQPRTESLRVSHRIGRELLLRIQRLHENAPDAAPEAAALVQVLLGDWALLYGHADEALALYRGARDRLVAAGFDGGRADLAFAGPVALPVGELVDSWEKLAAARREGPVRHIAWSPNYPGVPAPPHQAARTPPGPVATLRFGLRPPPFPVRSNAQDLRLGFQLDGLSVTGAAPDTEALRTQARRDVSRMVFRPRLAAGTPVGQAEVTLTYRPPASDAGGPAAGSGG